MKTGKNIDSIYRDRLKGAEMAPPQDAWENILSHLPQKGEKRKLFPLWMKFGGVAAALAVLFSVFTDFSNPSASEEFPVMPAYTNSDFIIPEVSTTFNEVMQETDRLLQELVLHSAENGFKKSGKNTAVAGGQDATGSKIFSEDLELKPEINVSGTENSRITLAEVDVAEQPASSNAIAVASPVFQKDEPAGVSSEKEKTEGKFKLSTRIAPVYFNNLGKGNVIDQSFSQNESGGKVTFSYGVNVAFEVSEKVNIRSGFHIVDLAYNTREISYNEIAATPTFGDHLMRTTTLASPADGTLKQKMGFFEIPLEMEYMLLDKRFAVGLIGGGSALFLEENRASLNTLSNSTALGEANSMNKLSFTTNFGLSLGYDVTRQLQLSMEPVIKLQLNTFKNNDNVNPYFFGIYSGFSYRF